VKERLQKLRESARKLRTAPLAQRNKVLEKAAELLIERQSEILKANALDLQLLAEEATPAFRDRLLLNESRLKQAGESLRQVAALPDPINEVVEQKVLANGLKLRRVRAPLGVIFMIFESRPNVALESFSLAIKSGNILILRGGKESMKTTAAIYEILCEALESAGFSREFFWGITDSSRDLVKSLLRERQWIDVVVPRGGEGLIQFVVENSSIPIIKNDRGLCHVYVHEDADIKKALAIVENAKTQRPGVCNAMETLLVNEKIASKFLPEMHERLKAKGVQWFGCPKSVNILSGKSGVLSATDKSFDTEYLDLKMSCKVVASLDEAIRHIEEHGSRHSESILTESEKTARIFQEECDAAAVYWNASTRFTDGFEFGLGGELGISTQKLHARGPVGLKELTSLRWIIDGSGQIRG
jgi:glutamate-5-semialdehyde dehydrogenase